MTNEEIIDELLYEAEELKIREDVLELSKKILDTNPRMDRYEAIKLSMETAKLHAGLQSF